MKEQTVCNEFTIKGFPAMKYFEDGKFSMDVSNEVQSERAILSFMADPHKSRALETPWSEMKTSVVHLTQTDFQSFLRRKKHVLVMFYAPWCTHCKRAKLDYTLAATVFEEDTKIEFAAVDCTKETVVCSDAGVSNIPMFKYFNYFNRKQQVYEGGRTHTDFVSFMSGINTNDEL